MSVMSIEGIDLYFSLVYDKSRISHPGLEWWPRPRLGSRLFPAFSSTITPGTALMSKRSSSHHIHILSSRTRKERKGNQWASYILRTFFRSCHFKDTSACIHCPELSRIPYLTPRMAGNTASIPDTQQKTRGFITKERGKNGG